MKKEYVLMGILFLLGLGLPLHGAITVFTPAPVRYWKELLLLFLALWGGVETVGTVIRTRKIPTFARSELLAVLFLLWLVIEVFFFAQERGTGILAVRYLGMGYGVYVVVLRLLSTRKKKDLAPLWKTFLSGFVIGCGISLLYGTWAKFGGGFEILSDYYAPTVSSWVPGQVLQIYHATGDWIRMQGASSGPNAFALLLLMGVWSVWWLDIPRRVKIALTVAFLFGIIQSASRAACLGVILLSVVGLIRAGYANVRVMAAVGGFFMVLFIACFLTIPSFQTRVLHRAGTSDHITRPIEAFRIGLTAPVVGHLGELGPAARAYNLRMHNDDKALIAENIFIDYWAQTGAVGLLLTMGFFITWGMGVDHRFWTFAGAMLLPVMVATVFDMTPVAIVCFVVLAFGTGFARVRA